MLSLSNRKCNNLSENIFLLFYNFTTDDEACSFIHGYSDKCFTSVQNKQTRKQE